MTNTGGYTLRGKRLRKIFMLPKWLFSCGCLRKRNFLITIIPLIPTIIFLVLVKYVVKPRWCFTTAVAFYRDNYR